MRPELAERVMAVVREMDYRPSRIARSLVTRQSGVLGVIHAPVQYRYLGDTFIQSVVNGVNVEAQRHRLDLLLYTNALNDEPDRALSDVLDGRSDGLVVIAPGPHDRLIERLGARSVPMVSVAAYNWPGIPHLIGDNSGGTQAAVQHLISLGHRKIGCITGTLESDDGRERLDAFRLVCEDAGLEVDPLWIQRSNFQGPHARGCASRILSLKNRPTAIVVANDDMATATIEVAREMGLRVPHDLSVVGYDDTVQAQLCDPPITSIHQPLQTMGEYAVRHLIGLLKGEAVPTLLRFPTSLVVRASTGPVPTN